MKSSVVLLFCVVSTHVLLVYASTETSDDGTSPLSSDVSFQSSSQSPVELQQQVSQDPSQTTHQSHADPAQLTQAPKGEPSQLTEQVQKVSESQVDDAVQQDPSPLSENTDNSLENKNGKIAGVFLNFTRELVNYTNTAFGKNKQSSDETEQEEEDVRIQDLLRGILADEFGSEEDEMNDDSESEELDVFHDDSEEVTDDDDESSSTTTTRYFDSSSSTTDSTDNPNEISADDDGDDGQVDAHSDDDDEEDKVGTEDVAAHEIQNERTSRADTVETTESGEREGRSRERKSGRRGNRGKKTSKAGKKKSGKTDAAKYNRYVDAVFKRMNTLIRSKRMDPLRVNLYAGNSNGNNKLAAKLKKTGNRGPVGKNVNKRGKPGSRRPNTGRFNPKNNRRGNRPQKKVQVPFRRPHHRGRREDGSKVDNKMRPSSMESLANKTTTTVSPTEDILNGSSESKEINKNQEGRPTRGVLHGLSTLRRTGPVKVVRRGQNTRIVRTKFLLGPVALEILSKKSNSTKSNSPSATATARSLKGVLEIRLKNSGPTRIRRLRVFPPSNVRVEGDSNGMKKQGYRKITPVAARRLMSVANQVVRQSDRHRTKPASKKRGTKNTAARRGQKKNNRKFGK